MHIDLRLRRWSFASLHGDTWRGGGGLSGHLDIGAIGHTPNPADRVMRVRMVAILLPRCPPRPARRVPSDGANHVGVDAAARTATLHGHFSQQGASNKGSRHHVRLMFCLVLKGYSICYAKTDQRFIPERDINTSSSLDRMFGFNIKEVCTYQ